MDFYSMGEKRIFQTAGMFELDARVGDEKLKIKNGKAIDVRFGSMYPGENYSFFYLNPQAGEWEWVDLPSTVVNQEKVDARNAIATRMPTQIIGDEFFVLNYTGFLDIYFNNDWYKVRDGRDNTAVRAKLESYKAKIYDATVIGEVQFGRAFYHPYELLWKDIDGKVFPTWTNEFRLNWERDSNNQWYHTNFKLKSIGPNRYEITYRDKNRFFQKRMEAVIPLNNLLRFPAEEWQRRYVEAMDQIVEEQVRIDVMAETFRAFSVNRLGVYNFDALMNMDDWFTISPTFTLSESIKTNHNVILIFGDNSGYLTLKPEEQKDMRINPELNHRILMMLPNNELGVFPLASLRGLAVDTLRMQQKPDVAFALESIIVEDAIALREYLGFK